MHVLSALLAARHIARGYPDCNAANAYGLPPKRCGVGYDGRDFDLFQAAYPLAAKHAARLFGASNMAVMLGEAGQVAAELSWVGRAEAGGEPASAGCKNLEGTSTSTCTTRTSPPSTRTGGWLGRRTLSKAS